MTGVLQRAPDGQAAPVVLRRVAGGATHAPPPPADVSWGATGRDHSLPATSPSGYDKWPAPEGEPFLVDAVPVGFEAGGLDPTRCRMRCFSGVRSRLDLLESPRFSWSCGQTVAKESRRGVVVRFIFDHSGRTRRVERTAFVDPVRDLCGILSLQRATSPKQPIDRRLESHGFELRNGTADTMWPDTSVPEGASKTKRSSGYLP